MGRRGQIRTRDFTRRRGRARAQARQRGRRCPVLPWHVIVRHVQKLRRSRRSISQTGANASAMKRIKIPRLFNARKLSAATARRASAASAGMDFEGIPEPNMKLSRALLIVLLLHVVAVSGIIAFNAIKTRQVNEVRAGGNVSASSKTTEKPPSAPHASVATKEVTSAHPETKSAHPVAKAS